jgi:hypothetical protein
MWADMIQKEAKTVWNISGLVKTVVLGTATAAIIWDARIGGIGWQTYSWILLGIAGSFLYICSFACDLYAESRYHRAWRLYPRTLELASLEGIDSNLKAEDFENLARIVPRRIRNRNMNSSQSEESATFYFPNNSGVPGPSTLARVLLRSSTYYLDVYDNMTIKLFILGLAYILCFFLVAFLLLGDGSQRTDHWIIAFKFLLYLSASNVTFDVARTFVRVFRLRRIVNDLHGRSNVLINTRSLDDSTNRHELLELFHSYCAVLSEPFSIPQFLAKGARDNFLEVDQAT